MDDLKEDLDDEESDIDDRSKSDFDKMNIEDEYLDKYLISSCHEDTLMDNFVDWLQTVVVVGSHFAIQKSIRDFWLVLCDEIQIKAFLTKIWMIAIFSVDEWTIFYVMQKDQGQLKHILDLYVSFFFFFFISAQSKKAVLSGTTV